MTRGKTIPIERLKLGMYVIGLDRSWFHTPFFKHRWLLEREEDLSRLKACGIAQVTIDPALGLDAEDSGGPQEPAPQPAAPSVFQTRPSQAASEPPGPDHLQAEFEQAIERARALRTAVRASVERVFSGIKTGAPLDTPALRSVVGSVLDRLTEHPAALLTVTQLDQMKRLDQDLFAHAVDVAILSLILGRAQGLTDDSLEQLGMGALLHDLGETRLPQNLFRQHGRRTEQDLTLLRLHPRIGLAALSSAGPLPAIARSIIAEHHERLDGSGYPDGLRGTRIAPSAQIVGLVDTYDAMASSRGGRPRLSPDQAVRQLFQLGLKQQYDRTAVELFIQCLGVYPFGSLVELTTGERAVVYAVNPAERLRPRLKLIADSQGRPYPEPRHLDLAAQRTDEPERAILRVLDATVEQVDVLRYCESATTMALTAGSWN